MSIPYLWAKGQAPMCNMLRSHGKEVRNRDVPSQTGQRPLT